MKWFLVLLLPLVAACAGDNPAQVSDAGGYISVAAEPASVRGTPLTSTTQITDFGLFCFYTGSDNWADSQVPPLHYNRKLKPTPVTGRWDYVDGAPAAWNSESAADKFTLFAYAPFATGEYEPLANPSGNGLSMISGEEASNTPRLRYTVPQRVESQPDLMVAVPRYNIYPTSHTITMILNHALTPVAFRIKGAGEKITGISLQGIATSGELSIDGSQIRWNGLRQSAPLDRYPASIAFDAGEDYFTAGEERDLLAGDGWLMMIPQRLGDEAVLRLDFDDGKYQEFSMNIHTWLPGRQSVYQIDLNENTGTGVVTISPATLSLSSPLAQFPVAQTLAVDCRTDLGDKAYDIPWRLTSSEEWLTLSLTDQPGSGTATVVGAGPRTLYIFAQMNPAAPRQANIYLGDPADGNILCVVQQSGI